MAKPAVLSLTQQSGTQIISGALRLVGSLSSGEVPTASELTDALLILNQMHDGWNAERVSIFSVARVLLDANGIALSLVANQQDYKLGQITGNEDFYLARPPRLERVSILYSASQPTTIELPMDMVDDVEWQGIANKGTTSLFPQVCYDNDDYPDRTLSFWPIPTQANAVVLYAWSALTSFADAVTLYSFPPGYAEAIRYNLAVRLAAEFPGDPQKLPLVMKIAREAKDRISSFNGPIKTATVGSEFGQFGGNGNIFTGGRSRSRT